MFTETETFTKTLFRLQTKVAQNSVNITNHKESDPGPKSDSGLMFCKVNSV